MNIKTGHFQMTAADINLDLGFVPDFFILYAFEDTTNPNITTWFKTQEDDAGGQQEGVLEDGSTTTAAALAYPADSQGITEYDAKTHRVMVESPIAGRGKIEASVADWAAATNYSTGERTVSTIGTIVRPPVHNGRVFELTTDTSTGDSEPTTWDVQPGETVEDGGGNIWTCIKEEIVVGGAKGVSIASQLQTEDEEAYFIAFAADQSLDYGDAADW